MGIYRNLPHLITAVKSFTAELKQNLYNALLLFMHLSKVCLSHKLNGKRLCHEIKATQKTDPVV